jgi:hypothetical protein
MPSNKQIVVVFAAFLVLLSAMQFTVPHIIGFDGYLHIKVADIIKQNGFIKEFPWAQHTILSENYADIQVLFRILLIPFTFLGLEAGAKTATVLFGAVCFTAFYWFLATSRVKYAFFWTLLYLFTAESLMYRFLLPREMPIAITLLILTIYFLQKKRYVFLALTSFAYALLYSGFVFQLVVAGLYLILGVIFSRRFDCKAVFYLLGGIILGLVINPYFPQNIPMLYTQIFKVNLIANLYNVEWKAWPLFEFIKRNVLVLFYLVIAVVVLVKNKKITKNETFYLLLSLFFFVFTLKSRRMQEYLVPFSLLAVVFPLNSYFRQLESRNFFKHLKRAALIFLVILAVGNFAYLRKDVLNNSFLHNYDGCVEWMGKNVKSGSVVFINAYAFPYLFFKNSHLIYTHGIDLTYSYLHDVEEFERYMGILKGTLRGADDFITKDYKPDYLFVGKVKQDVKLYEYIIKHKENYGVGYEDEWCAVLSVGKDL